jgi:hypothetical protein
MQLAFKVDCLLKFDIKYQHHSILTDNIVSYWSLTEFDVTCKFYVLFIANYKYIFDIPLNTIWQLTLHNIDCQHYSILIANLMISNIGCQIKWPL